MEISRIKTLSRALLVTAIITGLFFLLSRNFESKVTAVETSCPPGMDLEECLQYLQEQANLLREQQENLNTSISAEDLQQMSLSQQIYYLASLVQQTELDITEKELDIETKNVEINILGRDVVTIENNIDTITQELNNTKDKAQKRSRETYKMTFVSPVTIILDSKDLNSMVVKVKYLMETKKRDLQLLVDLGMKKESLKDEEELLNTKRQEIQSKRNEIEAQRAELAESKKSLEEQKAQQQTLLAESQRRQAEYEANLDSLMAQQSSIDQQISQIIMELYNSGQIPANTPVNAGDIVGFQGHTGFSYGSHLHFERRVGGTRVNPFADGYLTGGALYQPVGSGSAHAPLDGGHLTQIFHAGHLAIDVVSFTAGDQSGAWEWVDQICCFVGCRAAGLYPIRGEGAPVRATKAGMVTQVHVDACGGKYTIVDHGNGETTLYLHLR